MKEKERIPSPPNTDGRNADMLDEAFRVFTETTTRFEQAYHILEEKVEHLSAELAERNKELKSNVSELEHTRTYLNNVLESITDGVIACDLHGVITTANKAAADTTLWSQQELIGKPVRDIFRDLFPREAGDASDYAITESFFISGSETVMSTAALTSIPVIAYSSFLVDEARSVIGAVITFNDISRIRHLEHEVERGKRLASLGEMAASVAHEIRNPLGGIEMFASVLERDFSQDEGKKRIIGHIIAGVKTINRIITELLSFTKSFQKIHFEPCDLIDCLDQALAFIEHEIKAKAITVEKMYSPYDTCLLNADKEQLQQVFLNIALNAVQAMDRPGIGGALSISCDLEKKARYYAVRITDTGIGIEEKDIAAIFEPFFTTKTKGTGLGLAISKRIIEAHCGTIEVKSVLGHGTTFTIMLPIGGKERK